MALAAETFTYDMHLYFCFTFIITLFLFSQSFQFSMKFSLQFHQRRVRWRITTYYLLFFPLIKDIYFQFALSCRGYLWLSEVNDVHLTLVNWFPPLFWYPTSYNDTHPSHITPLPFSDFVTNSICSSFHCWTKQPKIKTWRIFYS